MSDILGHIGEGLQAALVWIVKRVGQYMHCHKMSITAGNHCGWFRLMFIEAILRKSDRYSWAPWWGITSRNSVDRETRRQVTHCHKMSITTAYSDACVALLYIVLLRVDLLRFDLHCFALICVALLCIAVLRFASHCNDLVCIALPWFIFCLQRMYFVLLCFALLCVALHCLAFQCFAVLCFAMPLPGRSEEPGLGDPRNPSPGAPTKPQGPGAPARGWPCTLLCFALILLQIDWRCFALRWFALHCFAVFCFVLNWIYFALLCIALHCIAYIALFALLCIALHCCALLCCAPAQKQQITI